MSVSVETATQLAAPIKPTNYFSRTKVIGLGLWVLLVLVCIWLVHLLQQLQHQQVQLHTAVQQSRFDAEQQLLPLKNQLQVQQAQLQTLQESVQAFTDSPKVLQERRTLQEAQYLLEHAQLNLHFLHDIAGAITLAQAADQYVRRLDGMRFLALRQQLAQLIVSLRAVPALDIAGTLARLDAVSQQLNNLPLLAANPMMLSKSAAAEKSLSNTGAHWHHAWEASLRQLQQLIIIRHHNTPIVPLLAPQQEAYLRHNLQLLLQQAQWAVLHHDEKLYQNSLNAVQQALQQNFTNNPTQANNLVVIIHELLQVNLQPKLPDLTPVLTAIDKTLNNLADGNDKIVKSQQQQPIAAAKSATVDNNPSLPKSPRSAALEALTL